MFHMHYFHLYCSLKMTHILIIFIAVLVVSKSIEAQTVSNYPAEFAEALEVDLFAKINTDYEKLKDSKDIKNLRRNEQKSLKLSNTGFVYQSVYVGSSTCGTPSSMYGEAVNSCHTNGGYSYKFQLVEDNCKGAFVEYYADQSCSNLLGTAPLDSYEGSCQPSSLQNLFPDQLGFPVYQSLKCTTADVPVIPRQPFWDPACEGLDGLYEGDKQQALTYSASAGYFSSTDCTASTSIAFHFESKDKKGQSYEISAQCYTSVFDSFIETDDDNFYFSEMIDEFQEVESLSVPVEEETLSEAELEDLEQHQQEQQGGDLDQPSSRQLSHHAHNNREEDDVAVKRTAGALIDKYGPLDAELDGGDQDDKDSEVERTRKVMRLKYEGRVVRGARDHGIRRSVSAKPSTRRLQQDQTEAQQQEDEEQSSTMYFLGICLNADDSLTELSKASASSNNANRKLLGVQPWIDVTTSTTTPTTISTTVGSGSWEPLVTPMLMLSSILVMLLCMTILVFAFPQKEQNSIETKSETV